MSCLDWPGPAMTESISYSDAIGIVASLILVIPAAKDNFYRFQEAYQRKKAASDKTPLRRFIIEAWRQKRDSFSAWDSLYLAVGGLGLAASFALKAKGL
jgi:hypothetical protein